MSEAIVITVLLVAIASAITSLELLRAGGWRPFRRLADQAARSHVGSRVRTLLGRDVDQLTLPWDDGDLIDADELSYRIGVPGAVALKLTVRLPLP